MQKWGFSYFSGYDETSDVPGSGMNPTEDEIILINVLFLSSENEISGIIYSLIRDMQNISYQ